jgi:hypothetical protein
MLSPNGKWLLITGQDKNQIDLWDLPSGAKRGTLKVGGKQYLDWRFCADGRLRTVWKDKAKSCFRVSVFELPNEAVVESVDVPCFAEELASFPSDEPLLWVYGTSAGEKIWDISSSPAKQRPDIAGPIQHDNSPDGRYRVNAFQNGRDTWWLEETGTGRRITESVGRPIGERTVPFTPAFSHGGRFLMLSRQRPGVSLPTWIPRWFARWWRGYGPGKTSFSTVLCDPATGAELRTLGGWGFIRIAPDGDHVWLPAQPAPNEWPTSLEEYPLAAPSPPWWLWALTAVGIGWYIRRIWGWRSARRISQNAPAPIA